MPVDGNAVGKFNIPYGNPQMNQSKPEEYNPYLVEVQKVAKARLVGLALGIGSEGGNREEPLAATVVKEAMANSAKLVERANEMADRKDTAALEARKEADKSKTDLYALMFQEMSKTSADLRAVMANIDKDKPPPRDAISAIKEAKDLLTLMGGEMGLGGNKQPPPTLSPDPQFAMQLEQMRENHDLAMKKFDAEMKEADRKFQLQMAQFQEDTRYKRQEYDDGKKRGGAIMENVMDIGQSILAGVGGGTAKEVSQEAPESGDNQEEPAIKAMVKSFPCQFCQTPIAVPDDGNEVTCPNEECGAKFTINGNK